MGDYGKLASLMGTYHEMALFRQFAALNAKSLLYMQSELVHLEAELSNIGLEDAYSGDGQKEAFRVSLFKLKRSSGTDKDLQWRKVMEIREKLKEYNTALLQYARIKRFEKPHPRDLNTLQEWLDRPEGGDFFLQGREADIWESDDLIALSSQQVDKDNLTRIMSDKVIPWYHHRLSHYFKKSTTNKRDWNGLWHYEDATVLAITNIVSTVLSSLLPTTSILILHLMESYMARLIVIMAFTVAFSLVLVMVAKARRVDVFAVTTA
ncbi:hypothetical protein MMC14_003145 [Varicellaria rhodocarpa]|nr:hypothetical protein [Varicellaria rhodocarpa]